MMIAPFALAIALGAAFLGLLGYVHHDGQVKGYRKHEIEVAEANAQAASAIAKAEADRDAAFQAANAQVILVPAAANCPLPEALRLEINRISRK